MKKHNNYANYNFSDYSEITGDALYTINGGAQVENTMEGVANAKPGDTIIRNDGSPYTLNQGDINWSNQQLGGSNTTTATTTNSSSTKNYTPTGPSGSSSNSTQKTSSSTAQTTQRQTYNNTNIDIPEDIKNNPNAYAYYMSLQAKAIEAGDSIKYKDYNVMGVGKMATKKSLYGAPTDSRRVTSPKGYREDADPKEHTGIDIGALVAGVKGDNIYSVENGTVRRNGKTDSKSTRLEIWLPNGDTAVYMHGDFLDFKTGDIIEKGQVLGSMSDKGCKGQVHLHFEIRTQGVYTKLASEAPDPLTVLPKDYQLQY